MRHARCARYDVTITRAAQTESKTELDALVSGIFNWAGNGQQMREKDLKGVLEGDRTGIPLRSMVYVGSSFVEKDVKYIWKLIDERNTKRPQPKSKVKVFLNTQVVGVAKAIFAQAKGVADWGNVEEDERLLTKAEFINYLKSQRVVGA